MRFNADRLAALAGVANGSKTGMLSEASNRSMHDDPSVSDESEFRFGKGQLAEGEHEGGEAQRADQTLGLTPFAEADEDEKEEGHYMEEMDDADEGKHGDEELVEIDESMLRREILKMRKERRQSVAENKVRQAVRREIRSMFGGEDSKVYSDSSWVYGDNKPTRSRKGQVTMGALGIGFE
jgi:hypothetical protein